MKCDLPVADLIDRLSILEIKRMYIADSIKLQYIVKEVHSLEETLKLLDYQKFLEQLKKINKELWHCNDRRKQKLLNNELDQEYIDLTVIESTKNDERFLVKNKINSYYDSEFREQKNYEWLKE